MFGAFAFALGCAANNFAANDDGTTDATISGTDAGSASSGELTHPLACDEGQSGCPMLLVSQTLDDRLEIFFPESSRPYRGAVDVDFKPNVCDDCGGALGFNGEGLLDEPFGLAYASDAILLTMGHYPSRQTGSLLTLPTSMFDDRSVPFFVERSEFFNSGTISGGATLVAFDEQEPIFVQQHPSGRLLISVFRNDLFLAESTWTQPGALIVFDPSAPDAFGTVALDDMTAGGCNGAGQSVAVDADTIAVACDGNESVAFLSVGALGEGSPQDAADAITGTRCALGPQQNRRVRYLAPDGEGGVLITDGPTVFDPLAGRIYRIGPGCEDLGDVQLPASDWDAREIVRLPGDPSRWLLARGTMSGAGQGVYVVAAQDGMLGLCGEPIEGLDAMWNTADGVVHPFALSVNAAGDRLAIGAGPLVAPEAGVGYGRVLWGSLSVGTSACDVSVDAVDLTDGGTAHAPAPDPQDAQTFRRGPFAMVVQEVQ